MSYDIGSTTTKKLYPENVGAAVGIFSLRALELEICLGGNFTPPPLPVNVAKKTVAGTRVNANELKRLTFQKADAITMCIYTLWSINSQENY